MLRLGIVFVAIAVGTYYAAQAPFYALLFYLGNAYVRPEDWVWGDIVRSLHLSLVIGVYVTISSLASRQRLVFDGRVAFLWLFLLFSILSCLVSDYSTYSWPYVIEFAKIIFITYLIVVLTTDTAKLRLAITVIVLGLGLEQAKQGWFYLLTAPGGANNNPVAFLGDNNGTAVGMLMLVPLIAFLMQTTQRRWAKWGFGGLLIGCLYRGLSTYSRGGFLAALAMAGTWSLRSQNKFRNVLAMVAIVSITMPALPDAFWNKMRTIETFEKQQDQSALGRLHYWAVAVDMASRNPIFGVGFNSYNNAYDAYDFSDGKYGHQRSVHNSFFGVLAELGYIGFGLYLLVFLAALTSCARVRRVVSVTKGAVDLWKSAAAIETSLATFVVGASFVPLQYNEMLWHILGLSIVLRRLASEEEHLLSAPALVESPLLRRAVAASSLAASPEIPTR